MKKYLTLFLAGALMLSSNITAFAAESNSSTEKMNISSNELYSIEFEDSVLENAIKMSSETYEENGKLITITKYRTSNGDIITDTFERSAIMALSKNGADSATRTRDLGDYGTISVTASFKWYTDPDVGPIGTSYVKCTGMSATRTGGKDFVKVSKWEKDYSSEYNAFGTAYAKLNYYLYNGKNVFQYQSGTIKITCDDTGAISDNA